MVQSAVRNSRSSGLRLFTCRQSVQVLLWNCNEEPFDMRFDMPAEQAPAIRIVFEALVPQLARQLSQRLME